MSRLHWLALVALVFSLMGYGIVQWRQSQVTQTEIVDTELTPDFIAEALKSDIYNDRGKLSHKIDAQRMEHYAELSFTHFEYPNYTLYPKDNTAPWKLAAAEGTLYNNNRVVLKNRVRLTATEENSLIQEIHCKYLELDLNTNIISSDQTIMIQGKDFTMYGSGLIIDLNTKQMTLTEHVQTIYKKTTS
ncbi:LPS export ABC transporter periplasmic protein LptC [Thalassotalea sp. M1531]|uniref:Lipopolysaccharide export system protein LptC n=1 Tax=Thalassotalea algicola TaxID=2716224 RepID=A0A7Y0L9M6_9GAMM|nr:LPS export ABC transporter periplasmic protein LptC [Thalassotalea algicola]NMP30158.1 LPS export ABC transporter periplasmic protein LptC [Thalassotalea algicola]